MIIRPLRSSEEMCKPKNKGELGVRDLRLVNPTLLAKRRLVTGTLGLWCEIPVARYCA